MTLATVKRYLFHGTWSDDIFILSPLQSNELPQAPTIDFTMENFTLIRKVTLLVWKDLENSAFSTES